LVSKWCTRRGCFTDVLSKVKYFYIKKEAMQSLYRPGVAQRVPGS
jgi:hypothetical protein